jgi:hypothetical protein
MIGPGWLPSRPISRLKRTLSYTRKRRTARGRRQKARTETKPRVHHDHTVIFHTGPSEFPVATVVPHDSASFARVATADLGRWFVAKWSWFRPRTVPVLVAALGFLAVLASANYLRHVTTAPPHYTSSR